MGVESLMAGYAVLQASLAAAATQATAGIAAAGTQLAGGTGLTTAGVQGAGGAGALAGEAAGQGATALTAAQQAGAVGNIVNPLVAPATPVGLASPGLPAEYTGATLPAKALPSVGMGEAGGSLTSKLQAVSGEKVGETISKGIGAAAPAVAGSYASKLLAGGTGPKPIAQPNMNDGGAAARAAAERERARKKGQGKASTLLTGPLGLTGPASVGAKMLLGQ